MVEFIARTIPRIGQADYGQLPCGQLPYLTCTPACIGMLPCDDSWSRLAGDEFHVCFSRSVIRNF